MDHLCRDPFLRLVSHTPGIRLVSAVQVRPLTQYKHDEYKSKSDHMHALPFG